MTTKKKKKQPPPKKKKKVVKQQPVSSPALDILESLPKEVKDRIVKEIETKVKNPQFKTRQGHWLRRWCEVCYVTSQQPLSLEKMSKDPAIPVSLNTLRRWSSEGNWVQKREDYAKQQLNSVKKYISEKQLEGTIGQIENLDGMFLDLKAMLQDGSVEANSYEGVVGAAVKVIKLRNELADGVSKKLIPETLSGGTGVTTDSGTEMINFSDEDARAAVEAVMSRRKQAKDIVPEEEVEGELEEADG